MSDRQTVNCEIFVIVDGDGFYSVGETPEDAAERFEDAVGFGGKPTRHVRVVLSIPTPTVPTLIGLAPDVGETALKSVE